MEIATFLVILGTVPIAAWDRHFPRHFPPPAPACFRLPVPDWSPGRISWRRDLPTGPRGTSPRSSARLVLRFHVTGQSRSATYSSASSLYFGQLQRSGSICNVKVWTCPETSDKAASEGQRVKLHYSGRIHVDFISSYSFVKIILVFTSALLDFVLPNVWVPTLLWPKWGMFVSITLISESLTNIL